MLSTMGMWPLFQDLSMQESLKFHPNTGELPLNGYSFLYLYPLRNFSILHFINEAFHA
jgi:hypothetical protein